MAKNSKDTSSKVFYKKTKKEKENHPPLSAEVVEANLEATANEVHWRFGGLEIDTDLVSVSLERGGRIVTVSIETKKPEI